MIRLSLAASLALAQIATAQAGPPLVVRDAHRSVRVKTIASANGPMLHPEALGAMLPVRVRRDSTNWYTLEVAGARLQLQAGAPTVRVVGDSVVRQLAAAPYVLRDSLLVPLQLISEIFPGTVPNTRWDADSAQLVVLGTAVASAPQANRPTRAERAPVGPTPEANLPPVPEKHGRRTVIVDAGHGGVDAGMSGPIGGGPRIYEKNITLAVAMKVGEKLKAKGYDVVYTRTTDTLIALDDRGRIANRAQGDLFISIHVNAANPNWKDPGGSRGFETYFLSEARTEDARRVEEMENSSVRFEDAAQNVDKNDPLGFILSDMQQNEHLRESSKLADLIQDRLGAMHPGPNRGVKQAGFRVLVTAYMPAVLVEIGFGTNPKEAAFISAPDKQDAMATAVAAAATDYLDGFEGRVRSAHNASGSGAAPR